METVNIQTAKERILSTLAISETLEDLNLGGKINPKSIKNSHIKVNSDGTVQYGNIDHSPSTEISQGKCYFHNENGHKNSHLTLYKETNTAYCYYSGCPVNDHNLDLIELVACLTNEIEVFQIKDRDDHDGKKAYMNALNYLINEYADELNIQLQGKGEKRELTEEEITQKIRQTSAEYYHWLLLNHDKREDAWNYLLEKRGFKSIDKHKLLELVKTYKVGFSPAAFGDYSKGTKTNIKMLYNHLLKKGYSKEQMLKAGVIKEYKDSVRDTVLDSVVIPYFSNRKIVNFYSRSMNPEYGHNRLSGKVSEPVNWSVAKKNEEIIFLEGEMDWFTLLCLDIDNSITARGTNGLTPEHIQMIKNYRDQSKEKFCQTVYLCLDPDGPGKAAIAKKGQELVDAGFVVMVIRLVDTDPNELLQNHGTETKAIFEKYKEQAVSYEAFMVVDKLEGKDLSTNTKIFTELKRVYPYLRRIPRELRGVLALEVADITGINVELLQASWLGASREDEIVKGFEEASDRSWMLVTESPELYSTIHEQGIRNVVLLEDNHDLFIEKFKGITASSIAIDNEMSQEGRNAILSELKDCNYKAFIGDIEEVKNSRVREFINFLAPISEINTYRTA